MIHWLMSSTMPFYKIILESLRNRASHDNGSCPGDVFHPDFQDGRSAFFDISLRSTTQPTFISSSASCAGVAAVAGEVSKDEDEKHLAALEKVGSAWLWKVLGFGHHLH